MYIRTYIAEKQESSIRVDIHLWAAVDIHGRDT